MIHEIVNQADLDKIETAGTQRLRRCFQMGNNPLFISQIGQRIEQIHGKIAWAGQRDLCHIGMKDRKFQRFVPPSSRSVSAHFLVNIHAVGMVAAPSEFNRKKACAAGKFHDRFYRNIGVHLRAMFDEIYGCLRVAKLECRVVNRRKRDKFHLNSPMKVRIHRK